MVSYFTSWLGSGVPEKWYFGIWESQPHLLNDYHTFVKAFVDHFGDPDTVEMAQQQLAALKQIGSASNYVHCFRDIAMHCQHSDYNMRNHFIEGLKVKVQLQLLAQDPIENLDELYWVAIDIDGQLYKMKR